MPSRRKELRALLIRFFPEKDDLKIFVEDWFDAAYPATNWDGPIKRAAYSLIKAIDAQSGLHQLFDALVEERDGEEAAILAVKDLWFAPTEPGKRPVDTPLAGERPFLDRDEIRDLAADIMGGDGPRLVLIDGGDGSGKTYCKYFLTHLEAVDGTKTFRPWLFDFERRGRVDAATLANALRDDMALAIANFESMDAQDARRTEKWIAAFDREARELKQTWCLFLDSMHKVEVPPATREFVEALAAQVDLVRVLPVRILLPGVRKEDLKIEDLRTVAKRREIRGLERSDVDAWVRAMALSEGCAVDEPTLAAKLDALFPPAPAPSPGPTRVAEALPELWGKVAKEPK